MFINKKIYLTIIKMSNCKIGKNNYVSSKVIIHDNVIIGDNNKFYDGTIIHPGTIIGNNNVFYDNNIVGEIPVQSDGTFMDHDYSKTNGIHIGDNNFFHANNVIFAGTIKKTFIGNNNKILGGIYIHHDCQIEDNICIYPRASLCGHVKLLNNSNVGSCAFIHQHIIVGQYSMIGGNSTITKHVFPYCVNINNKSTRLNHHKISDDIKKHEKIILDIAHKFSNKENIELNDIPKNAYDDIELFLSFIDFKN